MKKISLTPQQQAVVNHNFGPALVYAVAGAGKTTALEARIVRLVAEGIFAPQRILAAAYNSAVKEELGVRLRRQRGCEAVEVMTLHALGLRAVRMAWEAGLLPHIQRHAFAETEKAQESILMAALVEARRLKVPYLSELDSLDRTDFLTWLSGCKGNLFYPDLASLPPILRRSKDAQQAAAPSQTPWYLPFSQLMAQVQEARGLITFDDQLRIGWEVLVSHPAILKRLQQRYDCVLVDEFQDVNLAQYLILDMITAPRPDKPQRNYMVVGDDDQTIYEWRGANPAFILHFGEAYQATSYVMSENFRCPAAPLTLANQVIRHNRQRFAKQLRLTRGMEGTTTITRSRDRREMGSSIVTTIRSLLAQGDRIHEMAVLVRAKAQTPPVELALIQAQLPYEIVGSQPFYARWEVATLIAYCRLALFEAHLQQGKRLSATEVDQLIESWEQCYRHPKRYISQSEAQQISAQLALGRAPISEVLRSVVIADKPYVAQRLGDLAKLLEWLSGAFAGGKAGRKPAHTLLHELERKLGYCAYLEGRGTRSESGVDEAENVRQLIEEAKDRGTLLEYLVYLRRLSEEQAAMQHKAGRNLLTIRTIHSAKGLEWPVVIIPSCDDDNIPHRKSDNIEEERRLLYVALTRSRRDLYIYHLNKEPSSFLVQAKWQTALRAVKEIRSALAKSPAAWSVEELRAVAIAAPQLGLLDYFQEWHTWGAGQQSEVVQAALAYLNGTATSNAPRLDRKTGDFLRGEWHKLAQHEPLVATLPPPAPLKPAPVKPAPVKPAPVKPAPVARPQRLATRNQSAPSGKTTGGSTSRHTHRWETFDELFHPQYGRGIVISTTTTTRGRELKVQFVDGRLQHFLDDDPTLEKE